MVANRRHLAWAAGVVGGLATLRIVLFGFLDRRPHFGGAEGGDLGVLMRNHQTFRAPGGFDLDALLHLIRLEHHQPPLYYQGIPALFSPLESLSFGPLLLTNAVALVLALWAAWAFGVQRGSPRLGLVAVVTLVCLRAVAGRFPILGVEPWHMALLGLSIVLFLRIREDDATRRHALFLGGVIGAGLLMKLPFVAGLLGPLALEAFSALTGGKRARPWLYRLLLAGGVVVLLLVVGFLPFASSVTDFMAMAQTEPTHSSVFTLAAVGSLVRWTLVGIGPVGVLLVLLVLVGAGLRRAWETPRPALGFRPSALLFASIVSLGTVHWLIPHKEIRYLLPVAWSFGVLLAMGLEPFWDWGRRGRGVALAALLALFCSTFIVPRGFLLSHINGPIIPLIYDPQVPHFRELEDLVELEPPMLRLWMDPSDYGLEEIVKHESFDALERSVVVATLDDPTYTRLRDMIHVELYLRNDRPVISLPKVPSLLGDAVGRQLARATHVVTNRALEDLELRVLEDLEFAEVSAVDLPLPGPQRWSLWAKMEASRVEQDFAEALGAWEFWSDRATGEEAGYRLRLSPSEEGHPGSAAQIVRGRADDPETGEAAPVPPGNPSGGSYAMQHLFAELEAFHLAFEWRAYAESPAGPRPYLEIIDSSDGTRLHRQELSFPGVPDTGWLSFPPTDFSHVLPEGRTTDIHVRIGIAHGAPAEAEHILLVDNFMLDPVGLEAPPEVRLATDEAGLEIDSWSLWRLGSPDPSEACSLSLDAEQGAPAPAVHVVGSHSGPGTAPRYGIERTVPVSLPFLVSMDWLTRSRPSGPEPPITFELLHPDGRLLHSWVEEGSEGWSRYAPPDLSANVVGLSEVLVRIGVGETRWSGSDSEFWIDRFSWTAPCDAPQPYYEDLDGDGYGDPAAPHHYGALCYPLPGWSTDPSDCDDREAGSHPGAVELCDEADNDCVPSTVAPGEVDEDGDGQLLCDGDCDDTDPSVYEDATELCDGIDNNCDGVIEDPTTDYDEDGYLLCDGDCDDDDPDIWPDAVETCDDGVDQDCDGTEAKDGFDPECGAPGGGEEEEEEEEAAAATCGHSSAPTPGQAALLIVLLLPFLRRKAPPFA